MTVDRCGSCRFIDRSKAEDVVCRRFPPTIVTWRDGSKMVVKQYVPNVSATEDWCGEHQPSETLQ